MYGVRFALVNRLNEANTASAISVSEIVNDPSRLISFWRKEIIFLFVLRDHPAAVRDASRCSTEGRLLWMVWKISRELHRRSLAARRRRISKCSTDSIYRSINLSTASGGPSALTRVKCWRLASESAAGLRSNANLGLGGNESEQRVQPAVNCVTRGPADAI